MKETKMTLAKEEQRIKEEHNVVCERCGHEWVYKYGIPHYWIFCPKCKSRKNSLNREVFGYWHPEGDKK